MAWSAENDAARSQRTIESGALKNIGRFGWVAKGVVYALVGLLAVPIAFGDGRGADEEATRSGALARIAETAFGGSLLVIVGVGLVIYAIWRFVTAILPGDNGKVETWVHRAAYLFSGLAYVYLGYSAVSFGLSNVGSDSSSQPSSSGGQSTLEEVTTTLTDATGGRWLLGAGALVGLVVAGYFVGRAIDKRFMQQIDTSDASTQERAVIEGLGMAGWLGRAVTTGLLASFLLQAVWTDDPDEAEGLDGALSRTAESSLGSILVLVAGAGLIAYGLFAALSARRRLLIGP